MVVAKTGKNILDYVSPTPGREEGLASDMIHTNPSVERVPLWVVSRSSAYTFSTLYAWKTSKRSCRQLVVGVQCYRGCSVGVSSSGCDLAVDDPSFPLASGPSLVSDNGGRRTPGVACCSAILLENVPNLYRHVIERA